MTATHGTGTDPADVAGAGPLGVMAPAPAPKKAAPKRRKPSRPPVKKVAKRKPAKRKVKRKARR